MPGAGMGPEVVGALRQHWQASWVPGLCSHLCHQGWGMQKWQSVVPLIPEGVSAVPHYPYAFHLANALWLVNAFPSCSTGALWTTVCFPWCPRTGRSVRRPLGDVAPYSRLPHCGVWISLIASFLPIFICVVFLLLVAQKVFNQPAVLQEEMLCV